MSDKNLELALRVKTDFDEARRDVEGLNSSIDSISKSADNASRSAASVTQAVDGMDKSIEKTTASSSRMGSSFDQFNRLFAQTTRDLADWEAANAGAIRSMDDIAAQEERLDRLMAQGAITMGDYEKSLTKLDAAEAKLTKEHNAQERELQRVLTTADKTAAELQKLDAAAEKLNKAWRDGRVSTAEYEKAMGSIAKRRAEIDATGNSMQQLGLHTRSARSQLVTLGRDIASGNWESAATSIVRLSQGAESATIGFTRFLLPVGLVVGALGGYAAITYAAWQQTVELENALIVSGNAAGITVGQFDSMADSVAQAGNVTVSAAREISLELTRTGRFNREQIEQFGGTIARLQRVSGESTQALVRDFSKMSEGVAKWVAERNRSMGFVTAEQYEYIRSIEATQGAEAAQIEVSKALDKYLEENARKLGIIERGVIAVKNAAGDARQALLNVGRTDDEYQLEQAQARLEAARNRPGSAVRFQPGGFPGAPAAMPAFREDNGATIAALEEEVATLQARVVAAQKKAAAAAAARVEAQASIDASEVLSEQLLRLDKDAQMQAELTKLKSDWDAALKISGNTLTQSDYDKLEKAIRERYSDKTIEQAAKASEAFVTNLEKQATAIGKTENELRLLAISEQSLTTAQRERAIAANEILRAEQDRLNVLRDQRSLSDLETQLMRAQGNDAGASEREMRARYEDMLKPLGDVAKAQGQVIVDQLIDLNGLQMRLAEAEKLISQTLTRQQQQETSINTQREAGLITEAEARRRIVELHRETSAELEKQRPILEELASAPGAVGEAATLALAQLNQQAEQLNATMNLFAATMNTAIEGGLTDAISNLAKGTQSFQDAIRSLAQTVLDAIIQINAQQIAQSISSSAGGWVSAIGSAMGYATGGYTGPGGKYQVAGIVHKGEGVLSQEDIAALGGPAGFYNLQASLRNGYADGGLAGIPAPALPSPTLGNSRIPEPAGAFNATLQNNMSFNLIDDPQRIADALNTPAGEEAITVFLSKNGAKVRSLIGVN